MPSFCLTPSSLQKIENISLVTFIALSRLRYSLQIKYNISLLRSITLVWQLVTSSAVSGKESMTVSGKESVTVSGKVSLSEQSMGVGLKLTSVKQTGPFNQEDCNNCLGV